MAADENEEMTVVPLPGQEDEAERQRIRSSNDRDQALEREGKRSRHNRGYDEAADGPQGNPPLNPIADDD